MQQSDDERNENFNQLKPIFGGLRFNDPFGNSQDSRDLSYRVRH